MPYPHIRVSGGPAERGLQYGRLAAGRIAETIAMYRGIFAYYAGLDWPRAQEVALRFEPAIAAVSEDYLREMRGIAEGAGVDYADILAVNVRTEIMFSGLARRIVPVAECSAAAVLPAAAAGRTLIGQNWDWRPGAERTVVLLGVRRDDGPNFVTAVEAGLLAKTGMNEAGVGVVTNALVSEFDQGEPGMPYHVALRACLDAERASAALDVLERHPRSASANYLVAAAGGAAFDAEGAPGGRERIFLDLGDGDVIAHTNHFTSERLGGRDVNRELSSGTLFRLQRLRAGLRGAPVTPERFQEALRDHAEHPLSVCAHPDPGRPGQERSATIVSVVMSLEERRMWIADGNPCTTPYREVDLGGLLGPRG
ncbi:isopenicillin-N N-acyltransferase like protein [Marinactinospora thermotolerans DSM 45154]|uniref:Isopenicillin-N N-acyltransferase like protein n=1 Tax=Marinactinospora thermotolerans DSM 45154 TaxID=1122192 RepID=A0A1T4QQE5_9ACTN|nr:C45 family peptidase [Marinactinospora thermotolerans]SKA05999.1 isopenicillin-N N-acyltransferase like protein [Marinactinospora thermotolerans DSM 45154]